MINEETIEELRKAWNKLPVDRKVKEWEGKKKKYGKKNDKQQQEKYSTHKRGNGNSK